MPLDSYGGYSLDYLQHVAKILKKWGERSHKKALLRRQALRPPHNTQATLAGKCLATAYPWHADEYPGLAVIVSKIAGVGEGTARTWLYSKKAVPAQRARLLASHLESLSIEIAAAAAELLEYAEQRERIIPPGTRGKPFAKGARSADRAADD